MGLLTGVDTWTFDGLSFCAIAEGGRWPVAFKKKLIMKIDPILDGDGDRFLDIGGADFEPLPKLAAFETIAERNAFLAKLGLDGSLTNPAGTSVAALLVGVAELDGSDGVYYVQTEFEKV